MTQLARHVNKALCREHAIDALDKILISGVSVRTICGVFEWEKVAPRDIILDIELSVDLQHAGKTDDLSNTVDYDSITNAVVDHIRSRTFNLIETVAEECAEEILKNDQIMEVRITVHKPNAMPSAKCVSVCIQRNKLLNV